MTWSKQPLFRLVDIVGGGTPSKQRKELWTGSIPWVSPKDMGQREITDSEDHISEGAVEHSATQVVPAGSILIVVRSGILIRRLPIAIARTALAINQDIKALIPRENILSEFLAYALDQFSAEILQHCVKRGATVHSVDLSKLRALELPVPSISEQRRIVEILDQADCLLRLRTEADTKADRIFHSLFVKMFGDPIWNPMGWPEKPLWNAIESVEAGWSASGESRQRLEHEYGVLKVSAVTSGVLLAREHKAVAPKSVNQDLVCLRRGDLLISRANTRELVAASCVVEADEPMLFLSDKLWRVVPRKERATAAYLKQLFWVPAFRDRFRVRATGTSGSMLNLSQESFLSIPAPLPPIALQEKFTERANSLVTAREGARRCQARLNSLRTSLLMLAFSGQLTALWREAHMKELFQEKEHQAKTLGVSAQAEITQ